MSVLGGLILRKKVGGLPTTDLFQRLDLSGDFLDSIGSHNMTLDNNCTGSGFVNDRMGNANSAFYFDNNCGTANVDSLSDAVGPVFDLTELTSSMWVKKTANRPNNGAVYSSRSSTSRFQNRVYFGLGSVGFKASIRFGTTLYPVADVDFNYHHHFAVYDGIRFKYFFDKVKIIDVLDPGLTIRFNKGEYRIGDSVGTPFAGNVDHVLLYDKAHEEFLDSCYDYV